MGLAVEGEGETGLGWLKYGERLEMVKYTQTDKMEEVNPHNQTFK